MTLNLMIWRWKLSRGFNTMALKRDGDETSLIGERGLNFFEKKGRVEITSTISTERLELSYYTDWVKKQVEWYFPTWHLEDGLSVLTKIGFKMLVFHEKVWEKAWEAIWYIPTKLNYKFLTLAFLGNRLRFLRTSGERFDVRRRQCHQLLHIEGSSDLPTLLIWRTTSTSCSS